MRIAALTRFERLGASSRLRTFQYVPFIRTHGVTVDTFAFFPDSYLEAFYGEGRKSSTEVVSAFARRLCTLRGVRAYDIAWVEKELLPYVPAPLETLFLNALPAYIVDFDDAVFHRYDLHPRWPVRAAL